MNRSCDQCVSAIELRERDDLADARTTATAIEWLDVVAAAWLEMQPSAPIRRTAVRLIRVHPLRAGAAFRLAAALTVGEADPSDLAFVTLDERLARAAAREGFAIAEIPRF